MFTRAVLLNHLKDNKNTTAMGDAHEEVGFSLEHFLARFLDIARCISNGFAGALPRVAVFYTRLAFGRKSDQ